MGRGIGNKGDKYIQAMQIWLLAKTGSNEAEVSAKRENKSTTNYKKETLSDGKRLKQENQIK